MNNLLVGSKTLNLGEKLGGGGEGEVFKIADQPNLAVKLYNENVRLNRESKVRQMVKMIPIKYRNSSIVFPLDIVTANNQFVGFIMEVVNGYKPIHLLFNSKSRSYEFPYADYRFILRVAKNVASALAQVHQTGCIIGDINQSGILISEKDATARLIDTDSFQFSSNGNLYPCEVGMEDYTPPELQGQSLKGKIRTVNHDNFGLAVIIFQLLFMGMHPYAGRCEKKDLTMGEAIKENRFAYSLKRTNETETLPAKNALTLDLFPDYIRQAFESAFGINPSDRPDAKQWITILAQFEKDLSQCKNNRNHFFFNASSNCIWCNFAKKIHFDFFSNIPLSEPIHIFKDTSIDENVILKYKNYILSYFDIEKIKISVLFKLCFEKETSLTIEKITKNAEEKISRFNYLWSNEATALGRKLSSEYVTIKNNSIQSQYIKLFVSVCVEVVGGWLFLSLKIKELAPFFVILGFVMFIAGVSIYAHPSELNDINTTYKKNEGSIYQQKNDYINKEKGSYIGSLKRNYEDNKNKFAEMYNNCLSDFGLKKIDKLISLRSELFSLIDEFNSIDLNKEKSLENEMQAQKKQYKEKRENAYLSKINIQGASITSIGPQRKYVLNANGIYTAADISRNAILSIDGFGEYLTDILITWRDDLIRNNFVLSYSNFKVDTSQIERIKSNYNKKKKDTFYAIKNKLKDFSETLGNAKFSDSLKKYLQKRKVLFRLYADILECEAELKILNVNFEPMNLMREDSFFKKMVKS